MEKTIQINKENLRSFTGGDKDIMYDFLKLVIDDMPNMTSQIKSALSSGNIKEAIGLVHAIKPQLYYVGLDETFERAVHLMDISKREHEASTYPSLVQSIVADCENAKSEMDKFLAELKS